MRIYGNAGALVTATGSVDLPTAPIRHRDTLADPASKWAIRSPIPAQSEPGAPPAAPVTKAAPVARRMTDREYAAKAAARAAEQARRAADALAKMEAKRAEQAERKAAAASVATAKPKPLAIARERAQQARRERDAMQADIRARTETQRLEREREATAHLQSMQQAKDGLVERLRTLWATDMSQRDIAATLGISVTSLQRLRRESDIPKRRGGLPLTAIVHAYTVEKVPAVAIAKRYGVSESAILYQLAQAEVARRRTPNAHDQATRDRAVDLYRAGRNVYDIERECGVSETTLRRWLRLAGCPVRQPQRRPA